MPISIMSTVEGKKLKILCIHGYRQSAESFKEKLGAFRKLLKNKAELSFVNAPFRVPVRNGEIQSDSYGWWFSRDDDSFDALQDTQMCKGYSESLDLVCNFVREKGPFDGIMGFSQGAAFVALLCTLAEKKELPVTFKFAILVAGFKSRCLPHLQMYKTKVTIPSLHIYGENDQVIPKELSEELVSVFDNASIVIHNGGHFLPVTAQQKQVYLGFFETNCPK